MKKLILCIAAALTFSVLADAQITISRSPVDQAERLTVLAPSWSWLYESNGSYCIIMKSSNQFDENYWLEIGKTREECLETIKSLSDLAENIGEKERFDIENGLGDIYHATQYTALGAKGLRFSGRDFAGTTYLMLSNLNKAYRWIEKNLE